MRHNITSSEAFEDRMFLGPGPGLVQQRRTQRLLPRREPWNRRPATLALIIVALALVVFLLSIGLGHLGI